MTCATNATLPNGFHGCQWPNTCTILPFTLFQSVLHFQETAKGVLSESSSSTSECEPGMPVCTLHTSKRCTQRTSELNNEI